MDIFLYYGETFYALVFLFDPRDHELHRRHVNTLVSNSNVGY